MIYPNYTFTGIPLHFPFRLLCTFFKYMNPTFCRKTPSIAHERNGLFDTVGHNIETIVRCVIYVFQFLSSSSYNYIYIAASLPSYCDLTEIRFYWSVFSFNIFLKECMNTQVIFHLIAFVWCNGLYVFHTNK